MATTVEAILAAAYEDGSFPATAVVMKALGLLKVEDGASLVIFRPLAFFSLPFSWREVISIEC